MKLSEALIRRADAQKRIAQLRQRLSSVVLVQEPQAGHVYLTVELRRSEISTSSQT
jgi:hypothetical protein